MKITIMRTQLLAALCTAGSKDIRQYLNGVYVEATNSETRLASSTGSALALQRADAKDENDVAGTVSMIVPRDVVRSVRKTGDSPTVTITDGPQPGEYVLADGPTKTIFKPVEGRFPDWTRAIPRGTSGETAQFNTEFMALFAKAASALGATFKGMPDVRIAHNGTDGALVTLGLLQDYVGVLMPLRDQTVAKSAPSWAFEELARVPS
jgi:DNA polymerase III sliding clamp (beta) subunit (PCNA family)